MSYKPISELRRSMIEDMTIRGFTPDRYDKLGSNYLAMVKLAAIRLHLRFYESTAQYHFRTEGQNRTPTLVSSLGDQLSVGTSVASRLRNGLSGVGFWQLF